MLRSKCIKAPPGPEDGLRISIMSRHTMNDGVIPDPEITATSYDEWRKCLAPDEKILGAYLRDEIGFESFELAYIKKLLIDDMTKAAVLRLITLATEKDVTVLCVEETPGRCHRRILLEVCKRLAPDLEIIIA